MSAQRGASAEQDAAAGTPAAVESQQAPADAASAEEVPAPLTSLSSLLGGDVEGGSACAADGTCD